jgi:anti-sigma regulatory factor (Ser/Thr protein kinase)
MAMTTHASEPPPSRSPSSVSIPGGEGAPARARRHVLSRLEREVSELQASDAALIVSELVTNSVLHAHVGVDQVVAVELTTVAERLRIVVSDAGAKLEPRLLPVDPTTPHGFGLRLVDEMSSAWGVVRDAAGTTRVWCELPLDRADPDQWSQQRE